MFRPPGTIVACKSLTIETAKVSLAFAVPSTTVAGPAPHITAALARFVLRGVIMDQTQSPSSRSPGPVDQQNLGISQSHSPAHSPAHAIGASNYQANAASTNAIGLGLALDPSASQQAFAVSQPGLTAFTGQAMSFLQTTQPSLEQTDLAFNQNLAFVEQLKTESIGGAFSPGFLDPQQAFLNEDFTIYPVSPIDQLSAPLFDQQQSQPGVADFNAMSVSQVHYSPTSSHLLGVESLSPSSAHQAYPFSTNQSVQGVGHHSRNASLAPESALSIYDRNAPHFQGHRRTGSEYSDASSIGGHSPSIVGQDSFTDSFSHSQSSPMLRTEDSADIYQELHGINSFSISSAYGRSPSHSPAISPRIQPQLIPDVSQAPANYTLQTPNDGAYASYPYSAVQSSEAFPELPISSADMVQPIHQIAPTIEIDFAPVTVSNRSMFESKAAIDTDALTPPEQRGKFSRTWQQSPGGLCTDTFATQAALDVVLLRIPTAEVQLPVLVRNACPRMLEAVRARNQMLQNLYRRSSGPVVPLPATGVDSRLLLSQTT